MQNFVNSPATAKHCILPLDLFKDRDINRKLAIDLIGRGISVSIEGLNHSKWMLSNFSLYFGSANFSVKSLEKNIEVVTFRTFKKTDLMRDEFLTFSVGSMKKMLSTSGNESRQTLRGVNAKNDKLIKVTRGAIKRFNPSIKKVEETLQNIVEVRAALLQITENIYWLLQRDQQYPLWKQVHTLASLSNKIEASGYRLLEEEKISDQLTARYNRACDDFNAVFDAFSKEVPALIADGDTESYVEENRAIARENLKVFRALLPT